MVAIDCAEMVRLLRLKWPGDFYGETIEIYYFTAVNVHSVGLYSSWN